MKELDDQLQVTLTKTSRKVNSLKKQFNEHKAKWESVSTRQFYIVQLLAQQEVAWTINESWNQDIVTLKLTVSDKSKVAFDLLAMYLHLEWIECWNFIVSIWFDSDLTGQAAA